MDWGWLKHVLSFGLSTTTNWLMRRRLRRALESYPQGRTIEALRREAGEADTEDGRERTRVLLRMIRHGEKQARILKRTDPNAAEMWGLR